MVRITNKTMTAQMGFQVKIIFPKILIDLRHTNLLKEVLSVNLKKELVTSIICEKKESQFECLLT